MTLDRVLLNSGNDSGNSDSTRVTAELLYITQSYYDHDWPSVMHTHNFTELFYVLNGKGYFTIEDNSFSVKEDDLIIINPNVAIQNAVPAVIRWNILLSDSTACNSVTRTKPAMDYSFHNYSDHKHEVVFIFKDNASGSSQKRIQFSGHMQKSSGNPSLISPADSKCHGFFIFRKQKDFPENAVLSSST